MSTAILIGFSVVGILAIWDSYALRIPRKAVQRWGAAMGQPSLVYFIDCHLCKGFWLCLIGCAAAGNLLLIVPAYGVVAVCLAVMGDCDE